MSIINALRAENRHINRIRGRQELELTRLRKLLHLNNSDESDELELEDFDAGAPPSSPSFEPTDSRLSLKIEGPPLVIDAIMVDDDQEVETPKVRTEDF